MAKMIPLYGRAGRLGHAVVDDADYEALVGRRWGINNNGYAVHRIWKDGTVKAVLMHREIMGLTWGDGLEVDHLNHDALDNRRANLRVVTRIDNIRNSASGPSATSPFRAVYWERGKQRWRARPRYNGRYHHLGYFRNEYDAAEAIECWRREAHPEIPPDPALTHLIDV